MDEKEKDAVFSWLENQLEDEETSHCIYHHIFNAYKQLMQFNGGKEAALELKEKWFKKYRNRSAMKDELNKISELAD